MVEKQIEKKEKHVTKLIKLWLLIAVIALTLLGVRGLFNFL